jgi:hypothetical protein
MKFFQIRKYVLDPINETSLKLKSNNQKIT